MKKPVLRKFFKKKSSPESKKKEVHAKKKELPSISRSIPERLPPRNLSQHAFLVFVSFISGILLMSIIIQEYSLQQHINDLQNAVIQRSALERDVSHWQRIMQVYPDYRDGYFQLAILEYKLGNKTQALENNAKALQIDPNFSTGKAFAETLEK